MNNPFKHLYYASRHSIAGLRAAYRHEFAFRLEIALTIVLLPAAVFIADNVNEFLWLVVSWLLVLLIELINSAIEAIVDRVSMEYHTLSGRAKDLASAAVLFASGIMLIVWLSIIIHHLMYTSHS